MRRALGLSAVCVALTTAPPLLAAQRTPDQTTDPLARHKLTGSGKEIVFIDAAVSDYERLASALPHGMEVVLLDPSRDALDQITESLSRHPFAEAVHVISHGAPGQLMIGGRVYNADRMEGARDKLSLWFNPLVTAGAKKPDILIYGCNVGAGEKGRAFVNELAELTGADVEASSDLTGSPLMGGNWELEVSTGLIETRSATLSGAVDWNQTLAVSAGGYYNIFYVTTTADSGAGSLRQAVLDANSYSNLYYADVVVFGPTFPAGAQTITLTSGEIPITESVHIYGPTDAVNTKLVTVDGYSNSRIFNINDGDPNAYSEVLLNHFILTNGDAGSSQGGAIRTTESLTLLRTNVTYSSAYRGGGIAFYNYTPYQTLTLSRSNVGHNSAVYQGGGIWTNDLYANAVSLARSSVTYNSAGGNGGGIYIADARYSSVSITGTNYPAPSHSRISYNYSNGNGGGMHVGDFYNSVLAVTVADFNDNYANGNGGGMKLYEMWGYSTATITGGFYNNGANGSGGGFFGYGVHDGAKLKVAGFTDKGVLYGLYGVSYGFKDNAANSGSGGGIYLRRAEDYSLVSLGGDVTNNYSSNNGGGIYLYWAHNHASANLIGGHIDSNYSLYAGGGGLVGFLQDDATMTVAGQWTNNVAGTSGGGLEVGYVYSSSGYQSGGVSDNAVMTIGGTFSDNSASNSGGGIHFNYLYGNGAVNIGGSTISGNTAGAGGGVYVEYEYGHGQLNILTSTVDGNTASSFGGGIGAYKLYGYAQLNVNNSTISNNYSTSSSGGGIGVIRVKYQSSLAVNSSTISSNHATFGGGLFVYGDNSVDRVTVAHSTITANVSSGGGGGIAEIFAPMLLDHTLVAGNTAASPGAGNDLYSGPAQFYAQWSLIADMYNSPSYYDPVGGSNQLGAIGGTPLVASTIVSPTLADNGGSTKTHMLVAGGAAIDTGDPNFAPPPTTDQRGFTRVHGAGIDIGAVEFGSTSSFPDNRPNNHLGLANGGAGSMPLMASLMLGFAGLWRRVRRRVYGD